MVCCFVLSIGKTLYDIEMVCWFVLFIGKTLYDIEMVFKMIKLLNIAINYS